MDEHSCTNQKLINDLEKALFGNGRAGLKEDYLGFKSNISVKMTILMWLFGVQFAATMGAVIKLIIQ
jgi:hypothetical protein